MKKMTAVIICLTLVCASLLIFSACRRGEIDDFYDGDGYINIIRPDDIDERASLWNLKALCLRKGVCPRKFAEPRLTKRKTEFTWSAM